MHVEITLSTLINQLFTRTITSITLRVIFDFLNESKGVWMTEKCVSTSKQLSIICVTRYMVIPQEYIWDVQEKCNLHSSSTNGLGFALLHKYHSNIHQSHLQQYN